MSYISKRLLTKKAQKWLSKEVIEYLSKMEETKKAIALLNYAYYLVKEKKSVYVEELKKEKEYIDKIYIKENDNEEFTLYQILMIQHYRYNTDFNTLTEMAKVTDCYYFSIKLIRYEIPKFIIDYMVQEKRKSEWGFGSIYDILIASVINKKYNYVMPEEKEREYTKAVLTSPLVNYFINNNLHIHEDEYDKINSEKAVLNLCYSDKRDFNITKDGKLILFNNEYIELCKSYISNLTDAPNYICIETAAKDFDLSNIDVALTFNTIPSSKLSLSYNKNAVSVHIEYSKQTYSDINFYTKNREFFLSLVTEQWVFFAYERDKIFVKNKNKTRPASLSDLVKVATISPKFRELIEKWIDFNIKDYVFFKDFKRIFEEAIYNQNKVIPFSLNDLFLYNNWNEYFHKKYKNAQLLNINYGRLTPQAAYAIIQCGKYISASDLYIFVNILRNNPELANVNGNAKNRAKQIIKNYYEKIISCIDRDDLLYIQDWIDMCFLFGKRISLRKKSIKKIIEEHDDISTKITIKALKKEKDYDIIKNNSVFSDLRKILPESFEWIKTHKRLALESQIQHHCVLSYEERIKKDKDTIYSFVVPETQKRHTIEFVKTREGKFKIKQIQRIRDRGYDEEIMKYFPEEIITF